MTTETKDYTYIETNESVTINSKKPNKKGFIVNVSFTKNQNEHDESISAIKEFFVREVL
jgi:hypothetical protein